MSNKKLQWQLKIKRYDEAIHLRPKLTLDELLYWQKRVHQLLVGCTATGIIKHR